MKKPNRNFSSINQTSSGERNTKYKLLGRSRSDPSKQETDKIKVERRGHSCVIEIAVFSPFTSKPLSIKSCQNVLLANNFKPSSYILLTFSGRKMWPS